MVYDSFAIVLWGVNGLFMKLGTNRVSAGSMVTWVTAGFLVLLPFLWKSTTVAGLSARVIFVGLRVDAGGAAAGVNCEPEPDRMLAITREMRKAVTVPMAAQPAAFRITAATPCFTRVPQFPDEMEAIQLPRSSFEQFAKSAKSEGIQYLGGCCGCNTAYIHALSLGLAT
jgi:methionine synthase I (cobalamin-dependent)